LKDLKAKRADLHEEMDGRAIDRLQTLSRPVRIRIQGGDPPDQIALNSVYSEMIEAHAGSFSVTLSALDTLIKALDVIAEELSKDR
jgi:hypothetical protein